MDGQTFRDRCWTNKQALVNNVNTQLTQMIIRGEAPDRAISAIAKQFNVSRGKAGRLIMTESAYFASAAQKDCYNELGVERYKIVASFDSSTCELCGAMDGQVFKMSDYQTGLTAPPFHPWCRCCTAPYFEDMAAIGERSTERGRHHPQGPRQHNLCRVAAAVCPCGKCGPRLARDRGRCYNETVGTVGQNHRGPYYGGRHQGHKPALFLRA